MRRTLDQIVEASTQAFQLIQNLHAMFRKGETSKAVIDIIKLTETVLATVRVDLQGAQVQLELRLAPTAPPVEGNAVQLQQVILNLVTNPVEAMRTIQPRTLRIQSLRRLVGDCHRVNRKQRGRQG